MRSKLSVIVFDKYYKEHDYSKLEYLNLGIDLKLYDNCHDVLGKLNSFRGFDCMIVIKKDIDTEELYRLPFEFRRKWVSIDEFDISVITSSVVNTFLYNINREIGDESKTFSIFTCAHNTPEKMVTRLYKSLLSQTYNNWNWWILDDSDKGKVNYFATLNDPRIHIVKNQTEHGNIGFNKHLIASIADGDYLVEVDHDDELSSDCLYYLHKAFTTYKDCDFVYSYAFEELAGTTVHYDEGFELGLGRYENVLLENETMYIPITPDVNALSIRHIISQPNHVRCWKKEFYHKIGGHNTELSVLDDMDILIRTFLNGKMCKVPKVLYIQHEGDVYVNQRSQGTTTQAERFAEIQRTGVLLRHKYDQTIHDKLIELGVGDPYWNGNYSEIFNGVKDGTVTLNYTLEL